MADKCGYASALAEKYPEVSEAADASKEWHREIAMAICGLEDPKSDEAKAAVAWVEANCKGMTLHAERKVQVIDPETLEVITEGTPDLVAVPVPEQPGPLLIVDWKKPGQMFAGLVESPDDNLQLIAYGLSTKRPFRCVLVPLDKHEDGGALWGRVFEPSEHWGLLERVKRAATREQVPQPGQHCSSCYQSLYCHAYQARLRTALALVPPKGDEVLDDARAADLSQMIDMAEEWIKAAKLVRNNYVRAGGTVIVDGKQLTLPLRDGRESADLSALKAAGLTKYIKVGKPYEHPTWRKVK